jgi:D-alanyl-D-alanine carboxypeptidase
MKSLRRKKWLIVLLAFSMIIIGCVFLWPRTPKPPELVKSVADLEGYLKKLVDFGTPPGMSLVVVKNDSIVYSKGFGWADKPHQIRATPETVYHWFSITKIATAIAIFQLQEQGKLQLDDSVTKFLPFFKVKYPSTTSQTITIRKLLNHTSGLSDPGFRLLRWVHYEGNLPLNQTELVEKVLPKYSKLAFEPDDYTAYTNLGYMVLGAIIEKVTNQTYENYIRQNILEPLGMKHTDFIYTKEMEPFEAAGAHPIFDIQTLFIPYVKGPVVRETSGNHIWFKRFYNDQTPSSGLIGSATDAARLAMAYLNNGELNGRLILSEQSVTTMTTESYIAKAAKQYTYFIRQGIGWQIYKGRGGLMLQHGGGGLGFITSMRLYPDEKLGFILFTNDTKSESWRILDLAARLNW